MTTQIILYVLLAIFAAYVAWDKLIPRLKPILAKKSASAQAMIDLTASLDRLPSELGTLLSNRVAEILEKTLESCENLADKAAASSVIQSNSRTQATADLIAAMERLTQALNSDESTKMLAGTLKACEAIATATVGLRDEVAAFGKLVRIDDKQYPADQITQPDTSKDEMVATFLDALARGRSVQEAQQQSKDDAETKSMFSAVTLDPTQDPS